MLAKYFKYLKNSHMEYLIGCYEIIEIPRITKVKLLSSNYSSKILEKR